MERLRVNASLAFLCLCAGFVWARCGHGPIRRPVHPLRYRCLSPHHVSTATCPVLIWHVLQPGCDFSASIKGIGPKTALQGIKKHGDHSSRSPPSSFRSLPPFPLSLPHSLNPSNPPFVYGPPGAFSGGEGGDAQHVSARGVCAGRVHREGDRVAQPDQAPAARRRLPFRGSQGAALHA
eukprot:1903228-Rhodomonas_salina.1